MTKQTEIMKESVQWTIQRVDLNSLDEGYYTALEDCDSDCHHPVHAFVPERRKHLIEADLVDIAVVNNWWTDLVS